jgi:hypothetical protein
MVNLISIKYYNIYTKRTTINNYLSIKYSIYNNYKPNVLFTAIVMYSSIHNNINFIFFVQIINLVLQSLHNFTTNERHQ